MRSRSRRNYLLTLSAHQEVKDHMGVVATQSYRTVKFQGNKAKITFPGYLVVCLHGEIRTAHGCLKSVRLIGANGLLERSNARFYVVDVTVVETVFVRP